jgi:MFS family permease
MLKRIFTFNFLDAFIAGMTAVLVPLLMKEKGIGLATIGLVFSAAPLVKMLIRLASASLADFLGDKAIYLANAVANLAQAACYIFASTPAAFAAGKFFDGLRESLIFSVNRASLFAAAPEKKHFVFASLMSGRLIYNAIGGLAVGLLFSIGGFSLPLSLMAALSAYMLLSAFFMEDLHKGHKSAHLLSNFPIFGKSRKFYETSAALAVGGAFYITMIYMLLPIYFSSRGLALASIGSLYAAYFFANGIFMSMLSHKRAQSKKLAIAGAALFSLCLPAIFFFPNELILPFFVLMALGDACLGVLWEELNYLALSGSSKIATDLALVNAPSYLAVFAASAMSGFLVEIFGFGLMFAAFAASEIIFSLWALRLSHMKE